MSIELPPTIAAFFRGHNTGQTNDFHELFADDALVNDEKQDYRGAAVAHLVLVRRISVE